MSTFLHSFYLFLLERDMQIPTVELAQTGKGVRRARGRPVGVKESKPRKRRSPLEFKSESAEIRRLKSLQDAAIRKRRSERVSAMEEELPEPTRPPTTNISFGPTRTVVRYEMPEPVKQRVAPRESPKKPPPKVSPPKRKPFLSDSARQTLKRGAKAVGTAAASAAAAALARRYQTQLAVGADRAIGSAFDYFDGPSRGTPPPSPPPRDYPGTARYAVNQALERLQEARSTPVTPQPTPFVSDAGGLGDLGLLLETERGFIPEETDTPMAGERYNYAQDIVDVQPRRTPLGPRRGLRQRRPPQRQGATNTERGPSGRILSGRGLEPETPCEHVRHAGRIIFDLAESGEHKLAAKELKQIRTHMREIKKYLASLKEAS